MDSKKYTHQITYWILFFILVIIIGFLTMKKPDLTYKLSAEQMLEEVLKLEDALTPENVRLYLEQDDSTYKLVDLRNPNEYIIGHIDNALNIPMQDLLEKKALDIFNDTSRIYILYAGDQVAACAPWMLLKQLGYKNVRVLLGGYNFFISGANLPEVAAGMCYDEVPKYDYPTYFKGVTQARTSVKEQPEVIIPKRKKKAAVSGGC